MASKEEESEERKTAQAIMDGQVPAELAAGSSDDREDDIAQRIIDGEITDVDKVDSNTSVNASFAAQALRRASEKRTVSQEEAEMARKILNGELPE